MAGTGATGKPLSWAAPNITFCPVCKKVEHKCECRLYLGTTRICPMFGDVCNLLSCELPRPCLVREGGQLTEPAE